MFKIVLSPLHTDKQALHDEKRSKRLFNYINYPVNTYTYILT